MKSLTAKKPSVKKGAPKEGTTGKKGGIFKYMAPLELDKIREHEEKMAAALRRRHEMEVFVPEYEPPVAKRRKKQQKKPQPRQQEDKKKKSGKYLRYGPSSVKIGVKNKFADVKTYWPSPPKPPPPKPLVENVKPPVENVKPPAAVVDANKTTNKKSPASCNLYPIFNNCVAKKSTPSPTVTTKKQNGILEELSPSIAMQKMASSGGVLTSMKTRDIGSNQLIIDAGQKKFGATQCKLCNMVYSCNSPDDITQHVIHHQQLMEALRFTGWKTERLVESLMDGRIIKVIPSDPQYALRKVAQIRAIVDMDLGFSKPQQQDEEKKMIYYIYVSDDNQVTSFIVAHPLTQAYRLLPTDTSGVMVCSKLSEPVVCGISRVWTDPHHRRKGYASKLVDALRATFIFGVHVQRDEIAFSDPTPDGHKFASRYVGTDQFLTYHQTM